MLSMLLACSSRTEDYPGTHTDLPDQLSPKRKYDRFVLQSDRDRMRALQMR